MFEQQLNKLFDKGWNWRISRCSDSPKHKKPYECAIWKRITKEINGQIIRTGKTHIIRKSGNSMNEAITNTLNTELIRGELT